MENQKLFKLAYDLCVGKIRNNIGKMTDDFKIFDFAVDGNYFASTGDFFDTYNWTSSFFTGMATLAFLTTKDLYFLKQVQKVDNLYEEKIFRYSMNTMHDLGFLYSLYSVALYKTVGGQYHRCVALKAADELAKRFVAKGNYIRAWGKMNENGTENDGYAIIDCMMNIPLLLWASEETKNPFYREIAIKHAKITQELFVRKDYSVYHAYKFDVITGKPLEGANFCGLNVNSHWARGTTWAIYGFSILYGYTKDRCYLQLAIRLAHQFIKRLNGKAIPVWDFDINSESRKDCDSSAAAIAVSAFLEILKYEKDPIIEAQIDKTLLELVSNQWTDYDLNCPGILKGARVLEASYTSFGDYFLMEALAKYLFGVEIFW